MQSRVAEALVPSGAPPHCKSPSFCLWEQTSPAVSSSCPAASSSLRSCDTRWKRFFPNDIPDFVAGTRECRGREVACLPSLPDGVLRCCWLPSDNLLSTHKPGWAVLVSLGSCPCTRHCSSPSATTEGLDTGIASLPEGSWCHCFAVGSLRVC